MCPAHGPGFFAGFKKKGTPSKCCTASVRSDQAAPARRAVTASTVLARQADGCAVAGYTTRGGPLPVPTARAGPQWARREAQQASVLAFVAAQDWTLIEEFSDIASGKDDRRLGFQAALARCRQLGAMLVAARLDRITLRAHTLSQLLEDGYRSEPRTCQARTIL